MQPFIVRFGDLARGTTSLNWRTGVEFFVGFDNFEILDADIDVSASLYNHGLTVDADCTIRGYVVVACDRCLDNLKIPVDTSFVETYSPEDVELDLSQDIYDFVCISLPMRRVHPEGECNEDTIKYLNK